MKTQTPFRLLLAALLLVSITVLAYPALGQGRDSMKMNKDVEAVIGASLQFEGQSNLYFCGVQMLQTKAYQLVFARRIGFELVYFYYPLIRSDRNELAKDELREVSIVKNEFFLESTNATYQIISVNLIGNTIVVKKIRGE
jgi:hypothetical protein